MENQDKIQDVLSSFEKSPSRDIPTVLEDYLRTVAKTGKTVFPWQQLKLLFVQKLEQVMEQFNKDDPCDRQTPFPNVENTKFNEMRQRIIDALQRFNGAPFTVQRLCELVTQPKKHYTQCDKFLRGIEKNVMVVSTVDPHGRKIVSESHPLVNGLDMNGVNQQRSDFNDFTDGQPFGPGPLVDWSGNNVATVWPGPVNTENKSNSCAEIQEASTVEHLNDLKSDEKIQDIAEAVQATVAEESEHNDSQLVVKDSVVKDCGSSSVSSNELESQTEVKTDETEPEHTEKNETKDIANSDESSDLIRQQYDVSLDSEGTGASESESNVSIEENSSDTGSKGGKHAMDTNDAEADEPPEKKLKIEHSDEERVPEDAEDGSPAHGPAGDASRVQDSTVDSSQVQEKSTCKQSEQSEGATDTKLESSQADSDGPEEFPEAKSQPDEENIPAADDSQSKAEAEETTAEDSQSETSLQNTEKSDDKSIEESSNLDVTESKKSEEETKINQECQKQEVDGAEEQTGDNNSCAEHMDTETAPESKETAVEETETPDESEPMEQE